MSSYVSFLYLGGTGRTKNQHKRFIALKKNGPTIYSMRLYFQIGSRVICIKFDYTISDYITLVDGLSTSKATHLN